MVWSVIAIIVIVIAAFLFFASRKYANLFSPKHISEISNALVWLKRTAVASILQPGQLYEADKLENNTFISSQGLGVMYTVSMQNDLYLHHISLSHEKTIIAHSAAMTFASWVSYILDIPAEKIRVPFDMSSNPGTVWHITFEMSDPEETAYNPILARVIEPEAVTQDLWKQIGPARDTIVRSSVPNRPTSS